MVKDEVNQQFLLLFLVFATFWTNIDLVEKFSVKEFALLLELFASLLHDLVGQSLFFVSFDFDLWIEWKRQGHSFHERLHALNKAQ